MTTWKKAKEQLHAANPRLKEEYEKLGPRFDAIRALVDAREQAGLSQSEVARRMGVQPHVISRLESALHSPRLDTLAAYADALGLELRLEFKQKSGVARRRSAPRRVA